MNLCKDCKHYNREMSKHFLLGDVVEEACMRQFETVIRQSPLTGLPIKVLKNHMWLEPIELDPEVERGTIPVRGGFMDGEFCEPDGIFWERKER